MAINLNSCDKSPHELTDLPDSASAIAITLNTSALQTSSLNNIHLFFFDASDNLVKQSYFTKMESLALERTVLKEGNYTIFAMLNTEEVLNTSLLSKDRISFAELAQWVKSISSNYPSLLTGVVHHQLREGVDVVTIDLLQGDKGIDLTSINLNLSFPSPLLPDYIESKSKETVKLRCVAEVYEKGTDNRILRKEVFAKSTSIDGVYNIDLMLKKGEYDIRLWGDYASTATEDNHYNTQNFKRITILDRDHYRANSDTRDCFAQNSALIVGASDMTKDLVMQRPLAKYRLIATDVAQFINLAAKYGFPPIEEISVEVQYNSFLPCSYNVVAMKPNDSQQGYQYASAIADLTPSQVQVGKDYILVNADQSSVDVNVVIKDKNGKVISVSKGVKINYRLGYQTTVMGDFLTGGATGGNININTVWDDDYNVNF